MEVFIFCIKFLNIIFGNFLIYILGGGKILKLIFLSKNDFSLSFC